MNLLISIVSILSFFICQMAFAESIPYSDEYTLISDKLSVNFGTIEPNETKYEAVTLINNSYKEITISDMIVEGQGFFLKENTCPSILQPDERCVVVLGFSSNEPGIHNGYFRAFTERHSVDVSLTGSVIKEFPKLTVNKTVVDFGNIKPNEMKYDAITISNIGKAEAPIRDIEVEGKAFSIKENTCSGTLNPNQECIVVLSFTGDKIGSYNGYLKIFSDNFTVPIKLNGNVIGNKSITLDKSTIDFGILPIGEEKTKEIYIRNDSDVPITLVGVDGVEDPYSVSLQGKTVIQPQTVIPLKITFSPKESGEYDFDIRLITDDPNLIKIVHLKGKAVENDINALYFSYDGNRISEINFGNVFLLDRKEVTITLHNPTLKEIKITSIETPRGFEVSPQNISLPAFSNGTFKVVFSPLDKVVYSGTISFITSEKQKLSLPVVGKGIDFKFSSPIGKMVSYQINSPSFLLNKPEGISPIKAIGFYAYDIPVSKINVRLKLFMPYLSKISVFKVTPNGNWIELPFNPETKEISYVIRDNGQLDWDSEKGIIKDPIVVATKSSTVPQARSGKGTGGGCSIISNASVTSGTVNSVLPVFVLIIPMLTRKRKLRR